MCFPFFLSSLHIFHKLFQNDLFIDDPENSGIHVDDSLNKPDSLGRVLVNKGHPDTDQEVYLAPQIARAVKPHQVGVYSCIIIETSVLRL